MGSRTCLNTALLFSFLASDAASKSRESNGMVSLPNDADIVYVVGDVVRTSDGRIGRVTFSTTWENGGSIE